MKEFIESFKIAVINFFSGKSENESVDEMKLDAKGNIVYIHSKPKKTSPKEELTGFDSGSTCVHDHFSPSSDSVKHNGCLLFANSDGSFYKEGEEPKPTFTIFPKPKTKINKVSTNKKVKTKSKPKKVLNITIIHNKKPVTITEFSKISGIPYPVIKYHYYANNIKTSKELKNHLKPETLEKVKVKL